MNIDVVVKYPSDTDIVDVNGPEFARYEDIILSILVDIHHSKLLKIVNKKADKTKSEPTFIIKCQNIKSSRNHHVNVVLHPEHVESFTTCTKVTPYITLDINNSHYVNWNIGLLEFRKFLKELN